MSALREMFSDDAGHLSSTRPLPYIVLLPMMGVWVYLSVANKVMAVIDMSNLILIATVVGGKVIQKFAETAPQPPDATISTPEATEGGATP